MLWLLPVGCCWLRPQDAQTHLVVLAVVEVGVCQPLCQFHIAPAAALPLEVEHCDGSNIVSGRYQLLHAQHLLLDLVQQVESNGSDRPPVASWGAHRGHQRPTQRQNHIFSYLVRLAGWYDAFLCLGEDHHWWCAGTAAVGAFESVGPNLMLDRTTIMQKQAPPVSRYRSEAQSKWFCGMARGLKASHLIGPNSHCKVYLDSYLKSL